MLRTWMLRFAFRDEVNDPYPPSKQRMDLGTLVVPFYNPTVTYVVNKGSFIFIYSNIFLLILIISQKIKIQHELSGISFWFVRKNRFFLAFLSKGIGRGSHLNQDFILLWLKEFFLHFLSRDEINGSSKKVRGRCIRCPCQTGPRPLCLTLKWK